ncbi:MAG TPA: HAMP domain-containing sensor histidine kinase [Rhodocyclaceae bacterium]|nr:HAMP domain-containing sensor histidine kinase [Rhodocyclaceae bacterium]HRQ45676.1 HAMP domain-containing sensor histidine kinase [Rhodocyclaceae bacterium]
MMTTVVAGLFAIGFTMAIDQLESDLAGESMQRQLAVILAAREEGYLPHLDPDTRYYENGPDGYRNWPAWLDAFADGFHDPKIGSEEVHVFLHTEGNVRHALVATLETYERREEMLEAIALAGFLASVAAALVLGLLMSRRVIAPVVRLSRQVQHRDQLLPLAPPLAPDYADDEVGRLAAAFDDTLFRLREALEREQMFTSDVSHELRTPLMVIASSCELLLARELRNEREHIHVRRIQRACAEMNEVVETFLGLARAPSIRAHGTDSTLREIAAEQVRNWSDEATLRGLDLQLSIESEDTRHYSAPLLRTVMSNLLRNALHYTDSGFIHLVLRDGSFSVIDSGVGIPEHERERMFAAFTRGDTSRGDGFGIGLSLVQRICDSQGWQIALDERPEGGCEFRVRLRPSRP